MNFDYTMLSEMNCLELVQFQTKIQEQIQNELNNKHQKIAELKKSVADSIMMIVKMSGNWDEAVEVIMELKTKDEVSEPSDWDSCEEVPNAHEQNDVEEESDDTPEEEQFSSFAELLGLDDEFKEEPEDPLEYRSEEEYNLAKKRSSMLPPLETLLSDAISPNISTLGNNLHPTEFRQNNRITNAEGGVGPTLTTQNAPLLYIPAA